MERWGIYIRMIKSRILIWTMPATPIERREMRIIKLGCIPEGMMEAVRTSETSVDNYFTRQYIPEDNSVHHTRRRENLKSHIRSSCP
jgi:hypothetical protein